MKNNTLHEKLFLLLFNKFKLKIKLKNNSLKKSHLLKENRKSIARIKTLISLNKKSLENDK